MPKLHLIPTPPAQESIQQLKADVEAVTAFVATATTVDPAQASYVQSALFRMSRQLDRLSQQVTEQREQESTSEIEFINQFVVNMRRIIESTGFDTLFGFDRGYFDNTDMTRMTRFLMCDRLIALAQEYKKVPLLLWQQIAESNGVYQGEEQ